MDRIAAMHTFLAVVETQSFTQAAMALGYHKTKVSDQVAQLEKHLGVSLLARTTRAVVPTPEGRQYAREAASLLAQLEEVEASLKNPASSPQGTLRVEVPSSLGNLIVMPHIHLFLTQYPGISLDLSCTDRRSDLIREGVDCVVRGGILENSSLVCRKMCDLEPALYASPSYLVRKGIPLTLSDLRGHEMIGFRNPVANRHSVAEPMTRMGERVKLEMPARLIVTSIETKLQAGLAGLGIVYLTNFTVAPHLKTGAMVRVLPEWRGDPIPLSLLSPRHRFRTARVQVFMDWLRDLVRQTMPPLA